MISNIALFLTVTIGNWIMLMPVAMLAGGINSLRAKINPTAFQIEQELEEMKGNPALLPVAALAGFATVWITYRIFDHLEADFANWVVVAAAIMFLVHGVKNFGSGARVMGHIRVGNALGILVWLIGSLL